MNEANDELSIPPDGPGLRPDRDPAARAEFLRRFEGERHRLYGYIVACVASREGADDVFQESSLALWREFDRFRPGTDFWSWAKTVALNRVREFRRRNRRDPLILGEAVQEALVRDRDAMQEELDRRWGVLSSCLEKLRAPDRELFETFYRDERTAQEAADREGRSVFAVRKAIHRIRRALFDCVDRTSGGPAA